MSKAAFDEVRPDAAAGSGSDPLHRHIAQLQSALEDLEDEPRNPHLQGVFSLAFASTLALLPASLYTGSTRAEPEHFAAEFSRLKRNKAVRENVLGIGDIFIRRAIIEWELTGDDGILDDLETIVSERKGFATPTMGAMRTRFGQSAGIRFAPETRNRFQTARLRQIVLSCEKAFDGKRVAEAKGALRDPAVLRLVGAEWPERLNLLERVRQFQGSLSLGGLQEQRKAFKELLDTAALLRTAVGSARYRAEFQPNLSRDFLRGAAMSVSRFVWLNCLNFLEATKFDLVYGLAQLDDPHQRLAVVNRCYWFERHKGVAATPISYVEKYSHFFKDYDLRLINPSVGFAALGPDLCLFTPQAPLTPDKEPPNVSPHIG